MLVVLPGCGLHEAGEIAERLRLSVDGERIRLPAGELEISVTSDCSSSADFSLPTPEALVQASDSALYRGKNCVVGEIGHTIKGLSANLSLPFLWVQAFKLEKAGKTGDLIKARARLAVFGTGSGSSRSSWRPGWLEQRLSQGLKIPVSDLQGTVREPVHPT